MCCFFVRIRWYVKFSTAVVRVQDDFSFVWYDRRCDSRLPDDMVSALLKTVFFCSIYV